MGCITNLVNRRESLSASFPVRFGTSRSIFAATLPDFGKWASFHLKAQSVEDDLQLLWIPEGFAHGFLVLSETAEVLYKTTNLYHPEGERSIVWNDPTLNIAWPLDALNGISPSVSPKDALGRLFTEADLPPVG